MNIHGDTEAPRGLPRTLLLLGAAIWLGAATWSDKPPDPPTATVTDRDKPVTDTLLPIPLDPALARLVEQAKIDLARRHSATPDAVALVDVQSVMWPDAGLGCPRPGVQYPQVPVDGFLIRLSLAGRIFHYHQGRGRPPFLCEARSR